MFAIPTFAPQLKLNYCSAVRNTICQAGAFEWRVRIGHFTTGFGLPDQTHCEGSIKTLSLSFRGAPNSVSSIDYGWSC